MPLKASEPASCPARSPAPVHGLPARTRLSRTPVASAVVLICLQLPALAQAQQDVQAPLVRRPADLNACVAEADAAKRLECYDQLAGRAAQSTDATATAKPGPLVVPMSPANVAAAAERPLSVRQPTVDASGSGILMSKAGSPSVMSAFWELDADDKRGTFHFMSYRPNFFLPGHYVSHINRNPSSPTPGRTGQVPDYRNYESKLQVSIRTKVVEGLIVPNADLWVAYTQTSSWQVWNRAESSPFRATDHEPEAMLVVAMPPSVRDLPGGIKFRMVTAGIAHQSNGQTVPFSRSWNRVYAGLGFERGDVGLTLTANKRLKEDAANDDNPDLTYYRGRGDIMLTWTPGRATAALLWRTSLNGFNRGAWQFDYSYPVDRSRPKGLRWYVQLFHGYGETLIDYNFRQTSVGAGLSLFEF